MTKAKAQLTALDLRKQESSCLVVPLSSTALLYARSLSHHCPGQASELFLPSTGALSFLFFLSAGHRGRVSTLRRSARPTPHCPFTSLHFAGEGSSVEDPRLGAPFPSLAEEGALGSPAEGAVSPCFVQTVSGVQLKSPLSLNTSDPRPRPRALYS